MSCWYGGIEYNCMDIFVTVLTDEGLCCTFNAVNKKFIAKSRFKLVNPRSAFFLLLFFVSALHVTCCEINTFGFLFLQNKISSTEMLRNLILVHRWHNLLTIGRQKKDLRVKR